MLFQNTIYNFFVLNIWTSFYSRFTKTQRVRYFRGHASQFTAFIAYG